MIFHHIGVATYSIEKSIIAYQALGYLLVSDIFEDHIQGVRICFLENDNAPRVELIEPMSEKSPVSSILDKNNTIPYHSCFLVNNLEETVMQLKKENYIKLSKPVEAIAFNNKRICFLFHTHAGLIELLER